MNATELKTIALLPWGDRIEDFLDSIGVSFDTFCTEMTGGWLFGYVDALQKAGVHTVIICVSSQITTPQRRTHRLTGATICVVPTPRIYRAIHRRVIDWNNPSGNPKSLVCRVRRRVAVALQHCLPYLATPMGLLADTLRQEGCQAILCQEYEYARFDICVLVGKLIRLPVFASFQGGNFQVSRVERPIRPLTIRACTGLVIATQREIQRVQDHYGVPESNITRIFNPLDVATWTAIARPEARTALGISPEAQVVVCHGRIDIHRKGLDVLLNAWKQVCGDRPGRDLRLLLVGTGSDAARFQQMLDDMQLPGITWVNEYVRDRHRMCQYLSAADLYVMSSRHEGFPVAPIEAMACGLPVVATDAPGIADIFADGEQHGGLVVPCNDAIALATALGRVLDDADLAARLGSWARQRANAAFSLEVIGAQLRQRMV